MKSSSRWIALLLGASIWAWAGGWLDLGGWAARFLFLVLFLLTGALLWCVWQGRELGRARRRLGSLCQEMGSGLAEAAPTGGPIDFLQAAKALETAWKRQLLRIQALERERDHFRTVLKSMDEAVLVTDSRGQIVDSNPAFEAIFALPSPVLGRQPLEVLRNLDLHDGIQEVLQQGGSREMEIQAAGKTLLARFAPIAMGRGRSGVVAVLHDITELRRLERVRKDFVANISHELKTPLTSIQGFAETLLGESDLTPVQSRFLNRILRNAGQLQEIFEALLELSRLESAGMTLERKWIRWDHLVRQLRDAFASRLQEKELRLKVVNRTGVAGFSASEPSIRQVLSNLLDNACRFSTRGEIRLSIEAVQDAVMLSVQDQGVGIPKADQGRVFERFYRVTSTRGSDPRGSGIGLSIVRHIVLLHGGRVWLQSEPNRGTTVSFTLPRA